MTKMTSSNGPADRRPLNRRDFLKQAAGLTGLALLSGACGPAATPQTVEKIVTVEVEKVVKETVEVEKIVKEIIEVEKVVTAEPPPAEVLEIRFSSVGWGGWLAEPWMELVKGFNESQPAVQIPGGYEDIAEGYEKVMIQAVGGVAADVYMFETKFMQSFAARGFFTPLEDNVAISEVIKEEEYFAEDWKEMFWGGHQMLVPFDNSPAMLWYNKDVFDKAGVAYPPNKYGGWKWADFLETAQKLTQGEGAERVYGWGGERGWPYLLNWIWSNGGWLLNEEKTECVIDMPETIEALQWAADLVHKHQVQPTSAALADVEGGTNAMFYAGRAGMAQKGTWWALDLKAQEGLNWDVAPMPDGAAGSFVRNPLDAWGIWTGSQHREAAWQFIEFLSQNESLEVLTKAGLSMSKQAVMMSDAFLKQEPANVNWQLFIDALDGHTRRHPDTAIYPEMNNLLRSEWDAVLDGGSTVEQMAQNVKGPINDLLAECIAKGDCEG